MNRAFSASTTMRELGLLVDGPVLWGRSVPSRSGGVFVIELPEAQARAPIDIAALTRWLARVPDLQLDGARPTAHDLAAQLARFWLPGEPIVYVGRSAKSIGRRLASMYDTPLGDSRPYAGGHWLRTLEGLDRLRVWWAETDAQEEYEDALVSAVAGRVDPATVATLPDAASVLPYANLQAPGGALKPHGLSASLREPVDAPAVHTRATRATGRAAGASARPRMSGPRTSTGRTAKTTPPPPEPTLLSAAGVANLAEELEHLRNQVRPVVIERVKTARELGDLRENADYESARREQSFVEGRIQALEALIRSAVVVEADAGGGVVGVGSTVVVDLDGESVTWSIVGSSEADPAAGRISYASPVGQALLGRRAGEEADARLPGGELRLRVVEVR